MAFKLTKADQRAKQRHIEALQSAERNLATAINSYNEAVRAAVAGVHEAAQKWRREYEAKSARWQDGDAGTTVSNWLDEWEGFEPDGFEMPDPLASDELSNLPDEPS